MKGDKTDPRRLRIIVAVGALSRVAGFGISEEGLFVLDKAQIISYFAYASVYIVGFINAVF